MGNNGVSVLPKVVKQKPTKFFGKCVRHDGTQVVLVSKAYTEVDACKKLHAGYAIVMVLDLLSEQDMQREWDKIKPSLIQRSALV